MKRLINIYTLILLTLLFNCQNQKNEVSINLDALNWLPKNERVKAGAILVPENHDNPNSKKIQITYTIIKSKDISSTAFPIIVFTGGPGGYSINEDVVNYLLEHTYTENRDVILFDQRGIGYSSSLPDMSFDSFKVMAKDANEEEELALTVKMIEDYKKKCSELNIDPRYYNTKHNAKDVGMLFEHLGYEKYNLFGSSYGTRLGRVVQDMFPEFVYSVIFDSPDPIAGDFLIDRLDSYSEALNKIFDYCKNTPDCNSKYPKLENDYLEAITQLKSKPIKTTINDSIDFYVNAQDGIYLLRRLLYRGDSREKSPELIKAFLEGKGEIINEIVEFEYMFTGILNMSMLLSVEAAENFTPNITDQMIKKAYEDYPLVPTKMGYFDAFYRAGKNWHSYILPVEERKFEYSDLPTLILVNQFDPVTPPENGHIFMNDLSNGTLLILDEGGHGSGNAECKDRVMINFMDNPNKSLDTSCLNIYKEKLSTD